MRKEQKTSTPRDTPDGIHLTDIYCVPGPGLGVLVAKARRPLIKSKVG